MKSRLASCISVKGSSVYYKGERVNHAGLSLLCSSAYHDLTTVFNSKADKNIIRLRHGLIWSDLPYRGLLKIISRIVLDVCSFYTDVDTTALKKEFEPFAEFPSFLEKVEKIHVSVGFHVLYFADKSPAGYLYGRTFFSSYSLLEKHIRSLYPSNKYEVELISR